MMLIVQIILTVIMSIAFGLLMGIIGGGGGGIYVVVLLVFLHQNVKTAAMTALVLSTITHSGAAWQYWRKKQFRKDYFAALSILDMIGTLLGNVLLNHINENILKIAIPCVLVLSGSISLIKVKSSKQNDEEIVDTVKKLPITAPIGLVSGLTTGATGLVGSTMISSYLIGLLDFLPYLAVGTATLVCFAGNFLSISLLCMSSLLFHTLNMYIDLETLLTFGVGSAVGALFGAKLTTKINRKVLTAVLAAMAVISGIYLAMQR
jgi:uncharacterized protein